MPTKRKTKGQGEFDLIGRMTGRWGAAPQALRLAAGDDAAIWRPSPGFETLLTSDALVEGVHFSLKTISAWQLGARALAANLSDIAAMGGLPRVFLSTVAMPKRRGLDGAFLQAFADGAKAWAEAFGAHLAGGDLCQSKGGLMVDIMMLGEVEKGRALRRDGARPGDWLLCTGHPGDSAAGLAMLNRPRGKRRGGDPDLAAFLARKHLMPLPRVVAGRWLSQNRAATACIDISDGVAAEAGHLAQASKVGFEMDATAFPLSLSAQAAAKLLRKDPLEWALHGGEDYELLFTVAPGKVDRVLRQLKAGSGVQATVIGRAVKKRGLRLRRQGRMKSLKAEGYRHF